MAADETPQVELVNLRREFGELVAVDNVNLEIKRGEFFSLLGPSGCGKTTILRMISGFEQPTAGEVYLDGRNAVNTPPNKRDTNLVFQHLSLFPHMTVGENIGYGLKKSGVSDADRSELITEYLSLVDLAGFEDRKPAQLSGGQQQRVALARSLVNRPGVLLLDEPLASLDRNLRQRMEVELRRIQQKVRSAFFYVTHDQEVAMTLSDRLAIMNEGHIEQVGTPQEIYSEPASEFVADFMGDSNFFAAAATNTPDGTEIKLEIGGDPVFVKDNHIKEGSIRVGIRPENIRLSKTDEGQWRGTVSEHYFQGDQTRFVVEIEEVAETIEVVQGGPSSITEGDAVSLRVEGTNLMIFD